LQLNHARQLEWDNDIDPIAVHPKTPRPKKVKRIKVKYGTVLCSLLVLMVSVNIVQLHWEIVKLDKEIELQAQQKQKLLTYQKELQEDMRLVQSGDYIEKLAREQLGMVKPGENPVMTTTNSGDINN
jgi:cell division protein DivIC